MEISDWSASKYAGSELNSGEDICAHMTYTEVSMQLPMVMVMVMVLHCGL